MTRRAVGQTRIIATAPRVDDPTDGRPPGPAVTRHLVVDSAAFRKAGAQAIEDLQTLLSASVIRWGGDPARIVWTAEPVGPQIALAAVDGRTL